MSFTMFCRAGVASVSFLLTLAFAGPAAGQAGAKVDCGNGYYCPGGNACLANGVCGVLLGSMPPGSVKTSTGQWCAPGRRENKFSPGTCVFTSEVECQSGGACPAGSRCSTTPGLCDGGPKATGPLCGSGHCFENQVCASGGHCINPSLSKDCGNGTACPASAACAVPKGCAFVRPGRTSQIRKTP
jgi:hypothetical protein